MAENEGCRRTVEAFVVCTSPDVCWTQVGDKKVLIPYQIYAKFTDVVFDVPTVRFAGENSVNMDTRITTVYGDEEGIHGGEISGVNKGWCRPITHSTTIRVNGSYLIYHTTTYWMNCNGPDGPGNTKGEVQFFADGMAPYGGPLVDLEKMREEAEKSWWEKASPWVHGILDVVGFIPVVGEIADGANALIYAAEGNYVDAALSVAGMVPFVGWGATGAKIAKHGDELVDGIKHADDVVDALKYTDEAADALKHSDEAADALKHGDEAADAVKHGEATDGAKISHGDGNHGTIYRVPGEYTSSGKPYIGRNNTSNPQRNRRSNDGRDRTQAEVIDTYDLDAPLEGRIKEQQAINNEGGVNALDNKRNEIAPDKWKDYGIEGP